ncbi:MAG: hypothetical protein Q2306_00275 [Phytoplasma sp.]|uniref:hypothetical protein n=1 Tax=Phytoplasma sp. TaxID=2155 RepID=UPI002B401E62|nr:hypothetical protein [Phytoplasma sp.]WRH06786.1 MAG: hypothetical protein Q2306_00275 [Phytoplasma sp.]
MDLSINWNNLNIFISFFVGFCFGLVIFCLLYLFSVLKQFNKKIQKIKNKNDKLTNADINKLIKNTQDMFKKDIKTNQDNYMLYLLQNCKSLILSISYGFYPNSSVPYLEITIEESLLLMQYMHDRIDDLFNKKIIFFFKKMTLKQIFILKHKLIDKKYIEKYQKTNKILNIASNTLNVINPFHWAKKIFTKLCYNTLIDKIGCLIISIVGEEVAQIYSKQRFVKDKNIDINDILNELNEEIKNTK